MNEIVETQNSEATQNIQENTVQNEAVKSDVSETENPNEVNWRNFREQRKEERKQLAERERELQKKKEETEALKKALEAIVTPSYPQQPQQQYNPYPVEPNQDEEKRILDRVNAMLDQRDKEREVKRRQEEHAMYPQRLQNTYTDFNHVVSTENLDYLEYHYPEVAKPLGMLPDSYEKWEGIYKAVRGQLSRQ